MAGAQQIGFSFDAVTFDAKLAREARDEGIEQAASGTNKKLLLASVRKALVEIARSRPSRIVCADDGQAYLVSIGFTSEHLGNAAGAMFKGSQWEFVGFAKSDRVIGHGNTIRKWRLRDESPNASH